MYWFLIPLLLVLPLAPRSLAQSTWYVDQSGGGDFVAIQQAIDSPSVVSLDLVIVRLGTYAENIDFSGKQIQLVSESGPELTTIAPATGRAVLFDPTISSDATLQGFTITGRGSNEGGGIWIQGSPTIRECIFKDCYASVSGGAISCRSNGASLHLFNCQFINNEAEKWGGAIYFSSNSTLEIASCQFQGNTCGAKGGGLWVTSSSNDPSATYTIRDSLFESNTVTYSGSIHSEGGSVSFHILGADTLIENCRFLNNYFGHPNYNSG